VGVTFLVETGVAGKTSRQLREHLGEWGGKKCAANQGRTPQKEIVKMPGKSFKLRRTHWGERAPIPETAKGVRGRKGQSKRAKLSFEQDQKEKGGVQRRKGEKEEKLSSRIISGGPVYRKCPEKKVRQTESRY